MYKIDVHTRVQQSVALFNYIGLLGSDDETAFRKYGRNMHLVVYIYFIVSVAMGAYRSNDKEESLFLSACVVTCVVNTIRLLYILYKKKKMLEIIHEMGTYSINDQEQYKQTNKKINVFMKFGSTYMLSCFCAVIVLLALPFFNGRLPLNVYFTLASKNNALVYWIIYTFILYGLVLSVLCVLFHTIIWYLMMSCAAKYQILGNDFKNVDLKTTMDTRKFENQLFFLQNLIALIKNHRILRQYTKLSFIELY